MPGTMTWVGLDVHPRSTDAAAIGTRPPVSRPGLHDACRRDLITARRRASKMLLRHGRGGSGHEHRDRRMYEEDHRDDRHAPDQGPVAAVPSAPDAVLAVWLAFWCVAEFACRA
jgi:hypothetical protein